MLFILADNQEITKWGIYTFTKKLYPQAHFREAETLKEIAQILEAENDNQAIVILDYTQMNCTEEELEILLERFRKTSFIFFSEQLSRDFIRRRIYGSKRCSIILKDCELREIEQGLQSIVENEQYVCQRVQSWIEAKERINNERTPLTTTEREILKALALGKTTKDIAAERFLSTYTVMTHRKNIFRKLGVNNVQEAIRYALRAGIVDPVDYYI